MDELLKEILSQDKTLLTRREDLLKILDEKVPGNLRRTYAAVRKALTLNVGEILSVKDLSRAEKQEKIWQVLKESGMQEARITEVINIFESALNWNESPVEIPAKKINLEKNSTPPLPVQETETVPMAKQIQVQEYFLKMQQEKIQEETVEKETAEKSVATQKAAPIQKNVERMRDRIIDETSRRFSNENYTNSFLPQNHLDEIFTTEGRLNRWRFFTKNLKLLIMIFIGGIVAGLSSFLGGLIFLAAAIGGVEITVRRLHDLNKTGRLAILTFIPYVNVVFGLYLFFAKGTDGDNKYGRDPLY